MPFQEIADQQQLATLRAVLNEICISIDITPENPESDDAAGDFGFRGRLRNLPLMVRRGGHLRQVCDREHLPVVPEGTQPTTNYFRHPTADAAVDFVEDEAGNVCRARGHDLERQSDPGKLATGGNLGQRTGWLSRIGRDEKGHLIEAIGAVVRLVLGPLELHCEARTAHTELRELLGNLLFEAPCRARSRRAQSAGRFKVLLPGT